MGATLIDGKTCAAILHQQTAAAVARLKEVYDIHPALGVVLIGEDAASQVYVKNKVKACAQTGIQSSEVILPATISEAELLARLAEMNATPALHGILVQFPVPPAMRQQAVIDAIDPQKDVDGLHPLNAGRLASGLPALVPCTPQGCILLMKQVLDDLRGKFAVIIGRSHLVGKPLAQLLLQENATVALAHSHTQDLPTLARQADILVAAAGRAQLVKGDWVKAGALVIDVGIHRLEVGDKTRLVGDVDFDAVAPHAGYITPVPGGVGPMTVACLMRNTCVAACRQAGLAAREIAALFARGV